jgi:PKD repeat protein
MFFGWRIYMSVTLKFPKAIAIRASLLVLSLASLMGASTLQSQTVSADFGSRSGASPAVPSGLFSVGGLGTNSASDSGTISTFTSAGLNRTRIWISLQTIYATSSANFSSLDKTLQVMQNTGLHPLGVIYETPPSLGWNPCGPPSDVWRWGQMAASVVAHADQKFPGLMRDYEIWNEPELAISLCISDPNTRLNTYVSMFAAAASAMHAQASADGQTIRTGGPVISQLSAAPTWFPALLNNGSTAPYVNFVSFHLYITGQTDIWDGMDWSTLYSATQSGTSGLAYYYKKLEPLVRNGSQPSAWSTPIYITEYNDNWAYLVDCCRNDPTYGPLWNSVAIADLLNVVYSGATAVPSQLSYFSASGTYFCLVGEWNWDMDCNSSALDPYPQFYAFKLFASSGYLNLQNGGHMAAAVSPGSTTSGLNSTAFYTSAGDDMVIINPTSNSYNSVKAVFNNAGISPASGTMYLLNSSSGQISSQSVGLSSISGGYSTQVTIPAYSTVAIAIKSGTGGSSSGTGGTGSTGGTGGTGSPKAVLTVSSQSGAPPLVVTADSSASQGGGSAIVGRSTTFGDGTWVSWQSNPSHTYTQTGTYTIVVTIKNQAGQVSTASTTVTVQASSCYLCS